MGKVLVTGANGFLGSWLTRRLLAEGLEVFALVRKSSDLTELAGVKCQYIYGDVTDLDSLQLATQGIDSVFHLAGLVAYKKSDRPQMNLINVQGTKNILTACEQSRVRRLVHLSSVVAIGAAFEPGAILNETSEYNLEKLDLGYFQTKHQAELLVQAACAKKTLDAVIINPSTIYGPGDAKKGSRKTQLKVARGEFKFYTSGGVNVVALEDVVEGILAGWRLGRSGERYILASENLLIKELFTKIAQFAGKPPPPLLLPDFLLHTIGFIGDQLASLGLPSSISRENAWSATLFHWFDASKAKVELGFKPRSADIAIENSVRWMKDNHYLS